MEKSSGISQISIKTERFFLYNLKKKTNITKKKFRQDVGSIGVKK